MDLLVSQWQFNEPSGTTLFDAVTATGNNLTLAGSPTLGVVGALATKDKAVTFDGVDDTASIAHAEQTGLSFTTENFSIVSIFRFQVGMTNKADLAHKGGTGGVAGYFLVYKPDTNTLRFRLSKTGTDVDCDHGVNLEDGLWHLAVAVRDGSTARLYLDGTQVATADVTAIDDVSNTAPFDVGHSSDLTRFTDGTIDELAIVAGVLSPADVTLLQDARGKKRIKATLELELDGEGNGWTRNTDWTRTVEGQRGIAGNAITDRVASTGTISVALKNSTNNSAGLEGLYAPGHANALAGFQLGIRLRVRVTPQAVVRTLFLGKIDSIDVEAGKRRARVTEVVAVDWMDEAAKADLQNIVLAADETGFDAFQTVVAKVLVQPQAIAFDTLIQETYPIVFDLAREESVTAREELNRLAASGLGYIYLSGDGTLRYESRAVRATATGDVDEFADAELVNLDAPRARNLAINKVRIGSRLRRQGDSATDVLWKSNRAFTIAPGQVIDPIMGPYVAPDDTRDVRIGGTDMVDPPVSGTDYTANAQEDGGGANLTANLLATASIGANGVRWRLENTGAVDLWTGGTAGTLQVRGRAIYYGEIAVTEFDDPTSQAIHGKNTVSLDMPYQQNLPLAAEAAAYFVNLYKDPLNQVDQAELVSRNTDGEFADRILRREISDRVKITEQVTGIAASFFINSVGFTLDAKENLFVRWGLVPADATAYWLMEVVGRSELDQTIILGFGQILGHTDLAHADIHDDTSHGDSPHQDATHVDVHGDAGHTDVGHSDAGHTDLAHVDTHDDAGHSDVDHVDVAHADSHGDTTHNDQHSDTTHVDTHSDSHTDIIHLDSVSEVEHTDVPHIDHVDGIHVDVPHIDHDDGIHVDVPHVDHDDSIHVDDIHVDLPHIDSHSDVDHEDVAHADSHSDVTHIDTHVDTAHNDSHSDAGHTDGGHSDVSHDDSHSDTSHSDGAHVDAGHGDSGHDDEHSDTVHADVNHSDDVHIDSHVDADHGDIN